MKALITKGCVTTHGGIVQEADNRFLIEGIPVHLEGMKHFCPLCKTTTTAISAGRGFLNVQGRTIIMAGDLSTCGAQFLPQQSLVVRSSGGTSNVSSIKEQSSALSNEAVFDEQIIAEFGFSEGMPYFIETSNGKTYEGTIGSDGKLPRVETEVEETYQLYLGDEALIKGAK